jgi:acetate---CoA ligase (ADP-forming)
LGIVNTANKLTTSYFANDRMLMSGSIGLAAQSGIFVGALLRYLSSLEGLHLSKGIGLGNKVDVNEADALSYLTDDEPTKIIAMYLEDVKDGRLFLNNLREAVLKKPVLIIKSGRTAAGAKASASHTASLAVEDSVFDGVIRQAGAIRLTGIDDFIRTARGFLDMPLPRGDRLAFVTFSGAQAIMSIDAAVEHGLQVARLGEDTQKRIAGVIATPSKTRNPIDVFPDWLAHGYAKTITVILQALLDDQDVDGIVFISFADAAPEVYQPMADILRAERRKPVFLSLLGDQKDREICQSFLDRNGLPCYDLPEYAVSVFAHMRQYARFQEKRK